MRKGITLLFICLLLISCHQEDNAEDTFIEVNVNENDQKQTIISPSSAETDDESDSSSFEKADEGKDLIENEDLLRNYWDIDSKHVFDSSGQLHIYPFIKDTVDISPDVIETYNYEIEIFNRIDDEIRNGRDFSSLTPDELDIYSKYEMGITPWFVGEFCGWSCNNWFEEFVSSSELAASNGNSYKLENLVDGNLSTCWSEGMEGDGIGESISLTANTDYIPRILAIYNGYSKSEKTYYENNRVKQLLLSVNGNKVAVLELEDTMDEQIFIIEHMDGNGENFAFSFEILSVYKGDLYEDTCLSDFQIRDGHSRF